MNNLAAGALLIPSALDISRRTGIHPSKLLIPVSFGSLLGGINLLHDCEHHRQRLVD
ncbi:MAG: hypothetical protein IPK52_16440, partial [Chloroflexi bacterium]|nr:hypothetical protein [Chloroflexota bacterium]